MKLRWKIFWALAALLLSLWVAAGYIGADRLLFAPNSANFDDPAEFEGYPVEPVSLTTDDGVPISAWHVNAGGDRAVALFHGIGPNRQQMGGIAKCYLDLGYSVLLADLRRHGKSGHAPTSLGLTERHDVAACMKYLHGRYPVAGAHGFSLGAASLAFALRDHNEFSFLVFSSCFDTADHALLNRLAVVGAPRWPALPFVKFAEWRLGVRMRDLNPLDCIPFAKAPALFLSGDNEVVLTAGETVDLYNRCISPVKRVHIFSGGRHVPIPGGKEDEFRAVLRDFLAAALDSPPLPSP
ncbi:MAG: alpha/beta hydrolase [Candidatus Hydrogenedens sp.]|nr:alpha/beta hydrolase [Candidatus Hydrogenedentota bacterium]NLF57055.1 alpha/beta hydrolase [Candidatus Hydrogenedens sp.]